MSGKLFAFNPGRKKARSKALPKKAAPSTVKSATAQIGVGLDVAGEPQGESESPPGMTAEEKTLWARDGFFWRRGAFTPEQMQAAKEDIRPACA